MELFDIRTPDGEPNGQVKERSAVHRDGDWHGTAHIWLVRRQNGRLQVLLQKRSREKETFPGCFDTSCAGHLSAGDSFAEGAESICRSDESAFKRADLFRLTDDGQNIPLL